MAPYDLAIVGAGIVGLATARDLLARRPDLRLVVIDGADHVGAGQTGHNSGVVHAGIYYAPGSLKARLCVQGAARLYDYCEERGIAVERCGKLIVALDGGELGRLDELERRGQANGVPGLRRLRAEEIAELEPHCAGVAALHSPNTGIVDFAAVARAMADDVRAAGGELVLGRAVTGVRRDAGEVRLAHGDGEATVARHAVFCAGAQASRLARAAGAPGEPRIVPFRGRYLRLRPHARPLVRGLIYPVPDPALPFLGVHLTRHISGDVWLGPSALLGGGLGWPGTWRVARRFWRTGVRELHMAASRRAFVAACARYVPELRAGDVEGGPTGVRAQAVGRDGTLVDDFVLHDAGATLHVRNAPSPAATSSMALGELIADRARAAFVF
ncbi:MAG: (S)-2-hydroxyglutarate dehydrogenase [Solirubrobacteraceae bacterium]|nr:(S)-2-hydroxyglutarate dehydrogenase [Solirubrobacteraceae bacterium]